MVDESQESNLLLGENALDTFGPVKYSINMQNIPLLNKIINIHTNGVSLFTARCTMSIKRNTGCSNEFDKEARNNREVCFYPTILFCKGDYKIINSGKIEGKSV